MNCPRCSAEVTPQDKYCPSCGFTLEQAGKGGHHRKPVKRSYEEASTQVVDVDEFRKYMQAEKAQTGAPAAEAEGAAPKAAAAAAPAPAPKAAVAGDLNPSAMTGTGMHQPVEVPKSGTNPLVYVGVLVVVLLLAAIGYSMMGGGEAPVPAQPAPGEPAPAQPAPGEPAPGAAAPANPGEAPAQPAPAKPGEAPAKSAPEKK